MSNDDPKSAYELAMEKLQAKDRARGKAPPRKLTAREKDRLAEVRNFYGSKLAEREILYQDELKKAGMETDKREEVERAYREDREKLEKERDAKIAGIRG